MLGHFAGAWLAEVALICVTLVLVGVAERDVNPRCVTDDRAINRGDGIASMDNAEGVAVHRRQSLAPD
jgi:hypothetical protein